MAKKRKARMGRPPKPDAEKRKPAFMLNLTDAEYERLKRAAGDQKVSAWARGVILRAAKLGARKYG